VFPPLGGSDFLQDQDRTILAVVQGLSGSIVVNGETYNGVMPPTVLNDDQVADVLTYVYNSWGNDGSVIRPDMVSRVRGRSRFQTFEALERANTYPPLPQAPEGFTVRELVRLPFNPLRLAGDGTGEFLYVLTQHGDLFRVGISNGEIKPLLKAADYLDVQRGEIAAYGMALDDQKRLFISVNQRYDGGPLATNEVTIYRTTAVQDGAPLEARRWFATTYPWGVGYFNHGIGHMAFGPDGLLYVGSGSRTDANETGNNPRYSREGETPLTAGLWRLNPKADVPEVEVYARGLRNIFGFCWNDRGELFAVDNGPDADAPEEMNLIEQGRHYGFPYRFSDWTNKPYPHTPDAPEGLNFTLPIANYGPAAGGSADKPLFTFDAHSSPAGIVYFGTQAPERLRDSFVVVRFGNMIRTPKDVGFDLLQVRLKKNTNGIYEARMETLLAPLARPLDVYTTADGRIYIAEYTRSLESRGSISMSGRILELRPTNSNTPNF
jgi:glucose/arabinose dehydrogenase